MYLALARKYRPQNFLEVIGQDPIVQTLKNAIESKRLHHAYLFCGVRGVGKTSIARIMAKSINCLGGPTITPCQECHICKSVTQGNSLDVIEIDGASNNSVDDVRDLREQVKFLPISAKYKIIIIDEVHMLSSAAFNALLKTLEEPPAHVIFIFATTESNKLPVTILSRCQKYDFRKLATATLSNHLTSLAKKENIAIDATALTVIAQCAQGSVRDALSLLDQVAASQTDGKPMSESQVRDLLGLGDRLLVLALTQALVVEDLSSALQKLSEIDTRGLDLKLFAEEILVMWRHLILKKSTGSLPEDISPSEGEFINSMSDKTDLSLLLNQFQILFKGISDLTYTELPKTMFEILLVKLIQCRNMIGLAELVDSIKSRKPGSTPSTPTPESKIALVGAINRAPTTERTAHGVQRATTWYDLVRWLTNQNPPLGSMLKDVKPLQFSDAGIEIAMMPKTQSHAMLIERKNTVESLLETHFGKKVPFTIRELVVGGTPDEKKKF